MNAEEPPRKAKPTRKPDRPAPQVQAPVTVGTVAPGGKVVGVEIGHVENLILEQSAAPEPGAPPYKGLDFYDMADAPLFFGRERLTADLVEAVRGHTFLAIVGASGSGKSSLARAGLIAALLGQADRPLERGVQPPLGSRDWRYVAVTPTAHPFETLARGLAGDGTEGAALLAALTADPPALREHAVSGSHLLLLVDQFEELFTLCKNAQERAAYIDALLTACGEPAFDRGTAPCTVILTVRADFYDRCIGFEKLRAALERHQKPIGAMTRDELRRTIERPAEAGLWAFEGGLVELILAHVGEQPGKLPLLSYALLETWRRRSGRVMTLAGYQAAGGVEGAISQTAERVFAGLAQQGLADVARRILLSLVDPGQEERATRRREQLRALAPGADESPERRALLALSDRDARLVTVDGESVQISHEALITAWPKLGEWLTTYRDDLRLLDGIRDGAAAWAAAPEGERDNLLIHRGGRLEDALRLRDGGEYSLADPAPAYLDACVTLREREAAEKEAQRQRELAQARKLIITLASGVAIALLLAVIAAWFGIDASKQRDNTKKALVISERQATAGAAVFELGRGEERRAMLKALRAVYPPADAEQMPEQAASGVRKVLAESGVLSRKRFGIRIEKVAWSPNGRNIFMGSSKGAGQVWPISSQSQETTEMPARLAGAITTAAWSNDSNRLLVGSSDGDSGIWDLRAGSFIALPGRAGAIKDAAWSPSGALAATAGEDGVLRLWAAAGQPVAELGDGLTPIYGLAWISDTQIAVGEETGVVHLWDVERRTRTGEIQSGLKWIASLAWHQGTQQLLLAGSDVLIWDLKSDQEIGRLEHADILAKTGVWYPDGTRVIIFGEWGKTLTWRAWMSTNTREKLPDGREIIRTREKPIPVWDTNDITVQRPDYGWEDSLAFALSPTGDAFATGGWDGALVLWTTGDETMREFGGHFSVTASVQWHPDGRHFLTVDEGGTARIWDLTSGKVVVEMSSSFSDNPYDTVSWSPTGDLLLAPMAASICSSYEADGRCADKEQRLQIRDYDTISELCDGFGDCLAVWDWTQDRLLVVAQPLGDSVWQTAWAPNEQEILVGVSMSANTGKTVAESPSRLLRWDLTNNKLAAIGQNDKGIRALAYSDSGARALVVYGDGALLVWEARTNLWTPLNQPLTDTVSAAAWLNDKDILLGGDTGAVYLWDGRTWTKIVDEREHLGVEVTSIVKRPNAPEILTTSRDGTARVWRTDTWELADRLFNPDNDPNGFQNEVFSGSWSPTGGHILNATFDQNARLWIGREALAARLTERVCSTMDESDIQAEIRDWRGCAVELAAVSDSLAEYRRLMGKE